MTRNGRVHDGSADRHKRTARTNPMGPSRASSRARIRIIRIEHPGAGKSLQPKGRDNCEKVIKLTYLFAANCGEMIFLKA